MDENSFGSKDDPRSTEELLRLALTSTIETENLEDENGVPIFTPAQIAKSALKHRATREVLEAVQQVCSSPIGNERRIAAMILGELGIPHRTFPDECLQSLLALLHDPDLDVLEVTCCGLGHLGHSGAVPSLVKLKSHRVADVRLAVVIGLLTHEDELAVRTLIELSEDEDEDVRDWATFGLGSQIDLDTPQIRETLIKRLDDSGDALGEAMVGLARRKDERVLAPLLEALAWQDPAPGTLIFEAAEELADPRLYQPLLDLKERMRNDPDSYWHHVLDDAIAACAPNQTG